jgi:hypothetical protein
MNLIGTWSEQIMALATSVIAVGTLILAIGIPLTIWINRREEVAKSIDSQSREIARLGVERHRFYCALDGTYFEIQKLIIEHPHLSNPYLDSKTKHELIEYDAFAFLTWNFVESIYDFSKADDDLRATWDCILDYESKRHWEWFQTAGNQDKFKATFVAEMRKRRSS